MASSMGALKLAQPPPAAQPGPSAWGAATRSWRPASVATAPLGSTTRMRELPVSATVTLPLPASTATPEGLLNSAALPTSSL